MPTKKSGKLHITQKPLDFVTKLVTNSSKELGAVLDPFMGSGSTGKAALLEKFRFIGIEREFKYYKLATARCLYIAKKIHEESLQPGLFSEVI